MRLFPWAALFVFLNLAVTQYGGTNAMSRFAALRAATEGHTLRIDRYKDWTVDWSLSPNGHLYSNKAPGAFFVGLPIFAATDTVSAIFDSQPKDELGRRREPGYAQKLILVLLTQILPFALLILFLGESLEKRRTPTMALHLFALAALFGNTAALYMNSYFGHPLAAWLFLLCFYALETGHERTAGLCFGLTLLTDYGAAAIAPLVPAHILSSRKGHRLKSLLSLLVGALIPAALWVFYHAAAFGSPFAIASQFINPEQVQAVAEQKNHWGTFSFLPSFHSLFKLLFGPERGLLFTQPWLLLLWLRLPMLALKDKSVRISAAFLFLSLAGLLWINAGFGSWEGGWTIGPRYLCLAFPAFAYFMAESWLKFPKILQLLLGAGVLVSLAFRALTYPFSNLAPAENLWTYHLSLFLHAENPTPYARLVLLLIACLTTYFFLRRREAHR